MRRALGCQQSVDSHEPIASAERLARAQDYWLSIDRFVNWSDTASGKNDFYSDYKIKQMYKAHLRTFTSRVNTINGRKYSEDPTIYYWNLLNEPRWCALRACQLSGHIHAACLRCLRVRCLAGELTMQVYCARSRPRPRITIHVFHVMLAWMDCHA